MRDTPMEAGGRRAPRWLALMAAPLMLFAAVWTTGSVATAASPPDLTCSDSSGGGGMPAVTGATYNNVTIPTGQTCTLNNNTVLGNVQGQGNNVLNVTNNTTIDHHVNLQTGSTLNARGGSPGNFFDGNVTLQNGKTIRVSAGNYFGGNLQVNGLNGPTGTSAICDAFVAKDLQVQNLAATTTLNVGDTNTNSPVTGSQTCGFSDTVNGNVHLDNNAGFFSAAFTGGSASTPAGYTPCKVTPASGPPTVAAFVGNGAEANNNTGGFVFENTNVCKDLHADQNTAPTAPNASQSSTNTVKNNTTGGNFEANNDTPSNNISDNHADNDATCQNDSPVVSGNTAGHKNNC